MRLLAMPCITLKALIVSSAGSLLGLHISLQLVQRNPEW